jgi:tetratricopeptide (TPR) repeat protein
MKRLSGEERMIGKGKGRLAILLLTSTAAAATSNLKQDPGVEQGRQAYEASEYSRAIEALQVVAAKDPQNAEVQLLLAKSHYELQQRDAAVSSAERAVALDPQNSVYHEWLGKAYGEKAEHAGWFSAMSLARKTRKEFEMAVQLNGKNYSARQALIEFDCSAPGIVGGGEDKALVQIQQLAAMDAAEGHYAAGNCRRQKKDFAAADVEFALALNSDPKSADLIYDIGDYAVKQSQPDRLLEVAEAGRRVAEADPRAKFYHAVGLILKKEKPEEAEHFLREYLRRAPVRSGYPRPANAHNWLGRLFESQNNAGAALDEYEQALKLDPRNKMAQEAVKRLRKG